MSMAIYLEVVSDFHKGLGHNPYSEKLSPEKRALYAEYANKIADEYRGRRLAYAEKILEREVA